MDPIVITESLNIIIASVTILGFASGGGVLFYRVKRLEIDHKEHCESMEIWKDAADARSGLVDTTLASMSTDIKWIRGAIVRNGGTRA